MPGNTSSTPCLQGRRVRLEPLNEGHIQALAQVAFDPSLWRYMLEPIASQEDLETWVAKAIALERIGSTLPWVIVLLAEQRLVGATRLMDIDWRHRSAEIGNTWLSPELQGTGVNTEVKMLQLRFAFDELGMHRVAFKTHHNNLRSQAAIRKLGAVEEGRFRNHYIMPDGSQRHSIWYSITREDWPALRSTLEQRLHVMQETPGSV